VIGVVRSGRGASQAVTASVAAISGQGVLSPRNPTPAFLHQIRAAMATISLAEVGPQNSCPRVFPPCPRDAHGASDQFDEIPWV